MLFFSAETMTDAVMSDLVQRNAKFSCIVGVYWHVCSNSLDTQKVRKWQLPGANMCGKQYVLLNKQCKAIGDCLSVGGTFLNILLKRTQYGAQFQVFSIKLF